MECPHCGAENDGFLPTCSECGRGLLAAPERPQQDIEPSTAPSEPRFDPAPIEQAALDTSWAVGSHLAAFATFVIPFGNIIGPWVVWLLRRHDDPFAEHHAREALNFNISVTIYTIGTAIAGVILLLVLIGLLVLFLVLPALLLMWLILTIVAATKASAGEYYEYPLTLRLVQGPRA